MAETRCVAASRGERGIAAVEFAFLLPILGLLLFGLVQLGLAFQNHQVLSQASRAAVRFGVQPTDPKHSAAEIRQRALDFLNSAGLSVERSTVVVIGAEGEAGQQLRVRVEYPANIAIFNNFMRGGSSDRITLASEGVLEHE